MTVELIEDAKEIARDGSRAAQYMAGFAREGTSSLITNIASRPMVLRHGNHAFPVVVDDGGYGHSYVASPHSTYVLYAREEIDLIGMQRGRRTARATLSVIDRLLRAVRINRTVHLDHWLLATSLHGEWDGAGLPAIRAHLARRFPDHFLVLRSLDSWSCPDLLAAARDDGWILLPARQIWVSDDLARDWRPRNNYGNDRRALARSGLAVEMLETIEADDAARIADLYRMLYVGRYSALNPIFTDRFVKLAHDTGLLRFRVAREACGRIVAVAGMAVANNILTAPLVGYDTTRPPSDALYRIACFLFYDWAMEHGFSLHGSAGASDFKRNRGARGVIEYMAIHAQHLDPARRHVARMLAYLLEKIAVPKMQREGW